MSVNINGIAVNDEHTPCKMCNLGLEFGEKLTFNTPKHNKTVSMARKMGNNSRENRERTALKMLQEQ